MATDRAARPEEVTIPSVDRLPLHGRVWSGPGPRGVLVVSHGLGEYGGCYDHVAEVLTARPGLVDVLAFDYRGHGASPGRRGVVRRYEDLVGDLRSALDWAGRRWPGRPRFVLGHSNGGQVALRLARDEPDRLAGLALSNPSLRLALRVPPHKLWLGRVLRRLAPGLTLASTVGHAQMTRDPEMLAKRQADRLRHGRISPALFFGMVEGGAELIAQVESVRVPLLLMLGGSDAIVDPGATLAAFERIAAPDKVVITYPEMLHEPLNDLGRERVIADLADWLSRRLDSAS